MVDKCTVREMKFVVPCETLEKAIDNNVGSFSKVKGVTQWNFTNMKTGNPSRLMIGLRSKNYPKGMFFNFCPFCGEKIDAPFTETDEANHAE